MKGSTVILILGVLGMAAVVYILTRPPPRTGDQRPWYEKGLDAIVPDGASFGYAGFGVQLGF